jgi:hypothetical protein
MLQFKEFNIGASPIKQQTPVTYADALNHERPYSIGTPYSHVGLVLLGRVSGIHGRCGGLDAVTARRKKLFA